jgi:chitodextrinase
VTGYRLERCEGAACTSFAEIAWQSGTAFSDTALSPNTTYRYRVSAGDAASNFSGWSAVVGVTTYSGSDSQPPSVPAGLAVTAVFANEVALVWTASTDNVAVAGYRVERCQGFGCTAFVQIATPTGATYTDAGLTAGVVYRYRVRAADAAPNLSDYSAVVIATTPGGSGDTQPPSAPSSLTAAAYSATRIDLGWAASTDNVGVTGYFVERCVDAGCSNFAQIAAVSTITAYTDTGLTGGTTYRYRVRARDADGNVGANSPIAAAVTTSGTGTAGGTTYQYDSFGRLKQVTVNPN